MRLVRAHGLGNVYLVCEDGTVDAQRAIALCNQHTGVGADGVLMPAPAADGEHGVRIYNPDGSIAEKSGNGLRIYARWLHDTLGGDVFVIDTGACTVTCTVSDDAVTVQMGRGIILGDAAGDSLASPAPDVLWHRIDMGNPHCVAFVDDVDAVPWRAWGPVMEAHPAFPNRTNVQVAHVAPDHLAIRIWERGAGVTPASGSSACAVVVAAVASGRVPPGTHTVRAPGGDLHVTVNELLDVVLRGPVVVVGTVHVDKAWLATQ